MSVDISLLTLVIGMSVDDVVIYVRMHDNLLLERGAYLNKQANVSG